MGFMSFPPQTPYYVHVTKVQDANVDVSGAQFKLKNVTKGTEAVEMSEEPDSNISINLAECGDWDLNDVIKITATHYGKITEESHQVVPEDYSDHDFGTLALQDAGGGTLVNGGLVQ